LANLRTLLQVFFCAEKGVRWMADKRPHANQQCGCSFLLWNRGIGAISKCKIGNTNNT